VRRPDLHLSKSNRRPIVVVKTMVKSERGSVRHIIIDGYNVIRADPRLQWLEQGSMEHARNVLVQTLASSPRLVNDDIVVVFDGRGGTRAHVHSHKMGRIMTLYSARGQSADDVIVSHAQELARVGRVVVVSNDVEVREHCRAAGCEISASENLLGQIPGRPRMVQPRVGARANALDREARQSSQGLQEGAQES
jgi:predicted RNA-binding protein with PIN domain